MISHDVFFNESTTIQDIKNMDLDAYTKDNANSRIIKVKNANRIEEKPPQFNQIHDDLTPKDMNNLDVNEDVSHDDIVQNQGMVPAGLAGEDLSNYRLRREIKMLAR